MSTKLALCLCTLPLHMARERERESTHLRTACHARLEAILSSSSCFCYHCRLSMLLFERFPLRLCIYALHVYIYMPHIQTLGWILIFCNDEAKLLCNFLRNLPTVCHGKALQLLPRCILKTVMFSALQSGRCLFFIAIFFSRIGMRNSCYTRRR